MVKVCVCNYIEANWGEEYLYFCWFCHLCCLMQSELQSALQVVQTRLPSFTVDSKVRIFYFLFFKVNQVPVKPQS